MTNQDSLGEGSPPVSGTQLKPTDRFAFLRGRHTADRVAAGVVLVLSLIVLITAVGYGLFEDDQPGAGLYPAIAAAALIVLSLLWFVTGAGRSRPPGSAEHEPDPEGEAAPIDRAGARVITLVVAWTAVPLLLMERIGYILTLTIYVGGMLVVVSRARPWVALLGAFAGAVLTAIGGDAIGIRFPDPWNLLRIVGL